MKEIIFLFGALAILTIVVVLYFCFAISKEVEQGWWFDE